MPADTLPSAQPAAAYGDDGHAPRYAVPLTRVVSIEHPCIVRNFDNGFKSLGGEPLLKHVLDHTVGESFSDANRTKSETGKIEPVAGVSLRPNDVLAKKLPSVGIETRNVLVKVTLPKRTGCKRKRGSNDSFSEPMEAPNRNDSIRAPELLRRMQENESKMQIEAVGMLKETHRFRNLPDIQLQLGELPVMQELKRHVMTPSYDKLKKFHVDLTPGCKGITAFPGPPSFMSNDQPHQWQYQQAQGVRFEVDATGNMVPLANASTKKRLAKPVDAGIPVVPQASPPHLVDTDGVNPWLMSTVRKLAKMLDQQHVMTRRAALNQLPEIGESVLKEAAEWVGYTFINGPWKGCLIKYGIDPRKDPKYRFYQTTSFQLEKRKAPKPVHNQWPRRRTYPSEAHDKDSHIFDGVKASAESKTYQLCDITDPALRALVHTDEIRSECDIHYWGWYYNGTLVKIRTIMREKITSLLAGEEPPHELFEQLAALPNIIDKDTLPQTYFPAGTPLRLLEMTTHLRSASRNSKYFEGEGTRSAGPATSLSTSQGAAASVGQAPGVEGFEDGGMPFASQMQQDDDQIASGTEDEGTDVGDDDGGNDDNEDQAMDHADPPEEIVYD